MTAPISRDAQGLPQPAATGPFLASVSHASGPAAVPGPRDTLMSAGLFGPLHTKLRPHTNHALLPPQLGGVVPAATALLAPSGLPAVRPPRIDFLTPVDGPMRARINGLFAEAVTASRYAGMHQLDTDKFDISFVSRSEWREKQATRDLARVRAYPVYGLKGYITRIGLWLRRQIQTFTTAISFQEGPPGSIYVVRDNFFGRSSAEQNALMATALLQALQLASYPPFAQTQRTNLRLLHEKPDETDPRDYLANLAFSKLHVHLCLQAMPTPIAPVAVEGDSWTSSLMPWRRRGPDPQTLALVEALKDKPQLAEWMRTIFAAPLYARLLFQRGGEVELSPKELDRHQELFDTLIGLNPAHAPTRRPRFSTP